jgi:mono/diheme cytochrome c family protein
MKRIQFLYILVFSFLISGCSFSLAADVTPPPGYQEKQAVAAQPETSSGQLFPLVPPNPTVGKEIYAEKCAPCHGDSGLGDGPRAKDLPNPVIAIGTPEIARQATPSQWFDIVTQGNLERFMPPFPSLTDRQRWDVVSFVFTLSSTSSNLSQGAEIYQEDCFQCHGNRGKGDGPESNGLNTPDFTKAEYMAGRSASDFNKAISEGISPGMPAFGDKLSNEQRWIVADYLRQFSFSTPVAQSLVETSASGTSFPTSTPQIPLPTSTDTISDSLGTISGIVMNGSGGVIPPAVEVMLHAFDQNQLVYTATTSIESDGTYSFASLNVEPGWSFLTTVDYEGVIYGSELVTAKPQQTVIDLPVQIYETTNDTSTLSIDRLHYFFEFLDDKTLRVVELFIISNSSSKTLVAAEEGQPVVRFNVPTKATNLEFQDGELGDRYIKTDDGFGDTVPIRPGQGAYQLLFSYQMPFDRKLDLVSNVTMDTEAVVILVPEQSINVKGNGIEDAGQRDVQGTPYHMYNGGALKAGNQLSLTITGHPIGTNPTLSFVANQNLVIGLGALGLALVLAGVWMYTRNRMDRNQSSSEVHSSPVVEENAETVMDAILALDDLFQEGELPEEAYLERRGELKSRLKDLMDHQG